MTKIQNGDKIITLDMDGTMYDSWACCGKRDGFSGSPTCRHLRTDTLAKVRALQAQHPDAKLVVLSWRTGMVEVTRQWLATVGLAEEIHAYYIPGSPDDVSTPFYGKVRKLASQVQFKAATTLALWAMGVEFVGGFDDNGEVVQVLTALGIPMQQAPRLVKVEKHEWRAGYVGAPAAKPVFDQVYYKDLDDNDGTPTLAHLGRRWAKVKA